MRLDAGAASDTEVAMPGLRLGAARRRLRRPRRPVEGVLSETDEPDDEEAVRPSGGEYRG